MISLYYDFFISLPIIIKLCINVLRIDTLLKTGHCCKFLNEDHQKKRMTNIKSDYLPDLK